MGLPYRDNEDSIYAIFPTMYVTPKNNLIKELYNYLDNCIQQQNASVYFGTEVFRLHVNNLNGKSKEKFPREYSLATVFESLDKYYNARVSTIVAPKIETSPISFLNIISDRFLSPYKKEELMKEDFPIKKEVLEVTNLLRKKINTEINKIGSISQTEYTSEKALENLQALIPEIYLQTDIPTKVKINHKEFEMTAEAAEYLDGSRDAISTFKDSIAPVKDMFNENLKEKSKSLSEHFKHEESDKDIVKFSKEFLKYIGSLENKDFSEIIENVQSPLDAVETVFDTCKQLDMAKYERHIGDIKNSFNNFYGFRDINSKDIETTKQILVSKTNVQ